MSVTIFCKNHMLIIKDEIKSLISPLSLEEKSQLEANILAEGCRDPLIVWNSPRKETILLDGHNRYDLCVKHQLAFTTSSLDFKDIEEAKDWMINNQLGRRNLNPDQLSYLRGLKYERLKQKRGGAQLASAKSQNGTSTKNKLAAEFSVSKNTILRDAQFSRGLNFIGQINSELKHNILSGKANVKKSDIGLLADIPDKIMIRTIKNEADLHNKIQIIKKEKTKRIEVNEKRIRENRVLDAQETLKAMEPVFNTQDERFNKLKGNIISAVNRAIRQRDEQAIEELESLVLRLRNELFGKISIKKV